MTFFPLVIDLIFRIFPFFSHIFRMLTMLNVVYDPFLKRIPPFFYSIYTFTRIRQHYFSKYWGGLMHGPSPHLKSLGGPSPVPPRSPSLNFDQGWTGPPGHREKSRWTGPPEWVISWPPGPLAQDAHYNKLTKLRNV